MTDDVATLSIAVDSKGIRISREELNRLSATGAKTERNVKTATGKMRSNFDRVRSSVVSLQGAFAALAVGAVFTRIIKATSDFEQGLVGVGKTTGIAGAQLEALGEDIREVGSRVPVATTELLSLGQAAGQLGVKGRDNIAKFTETIAKLGIASDLAGEQAATTFARLLTVTGTPIKDVDRLGASIVALGNNYAATESEIATVATRVGQSTSQFDVSADEVLGIGTALRAVGVEAEAGGTQVGLAFQSINDALRQGGEQMQTLQVITGETGDALRDNFFNGKSAQVFDDLIKGLGKIQRNGGDVKEALDALGLKGVRATQVLGTLATRSGILERALRDSSRAYEENNALNQEAATATDTFENQLKLLGNAFNDILSSGNIDDLTSSVGDLTDALKDPEFKSGIQFIVQGILDATTHTAELITEIATLKETLSKPFDLSDTLKFIFDRSGPGFVYNNFIKEEQQGGATGSFGPNGATGSYGEPEQMGAISVTGSTPAYGRDNPLSLESLSGLPDLTLPSASGGGGSQRLSEAQRLIAQLQKQKALYGDLSHAEEARISLANGYYGKVSESQAAEILRLSQSLDLRDQAAEQKQAEIDLQERLNQKEQERRATVQQLTDTLATDDERAIAANERRLRLINENVVSEQTANELRARSWQRLTDDINGNAEAASAFAEQAARNIQDELGDTLRDTLSGDFDGILDSWANMLLDMAAQAQAAQLSKLLLGDFGSQGGDGKDGGLFGKIAGIAGTAIGGLFGGGGGVAASSTVGGSATGAAPLSLEALSGIGGAFASGGTMPAGKWSLVGENGPEWARPNAPTTVLPNGVQPGAGTPNVVVNITSNGPPIESQETTTRQAANGELILDVQVDQSLSRLRRSGKFEKHMRPYTGGGKIGRS